MKTPWKFERIPDYVESGTLLKRELAPHEGYPRDNDGSWIITDSTGERVATVPFRGTAKRGEKWNAPDPEGQRIAELIVKAVNSYKK